MRTERYYVYVSPGHIRYFDDFREACNYAEYYQVHVNDISLDRATQEAEM